ncbi:MAG: LemA family protein [Candidatus Limisoma sp.]|nr:LemA family protein [Muribaculaceae bacterium]MDD6869079.1 LemA family protein [bacterium]MDY5828091.1 LemA family protein [Candidatus Limisoma sp.]
MKKSILWIVLGGLLLIVLIFGGCSVSKYNTMVELNQNVEQTWGNVQNYYQRRADLVPNLVSTVKGAAAHEANTLQAVTDARAKVGSINITADNLTEETLKQYQEAQNELTQAMKSVMMVAESYPNITGTQNFRDLQVQLEGAENRIATARMDYTKAVSEYNTAVQSFPGNIVASLFGFEKKPQFAADASAQTAPKVEF